MRFDWSSFSPFEKTIAVAAAFELVLFLCVAALSAIAIGQSYLVYWFVLGPPSLLFAPLLHRLFRYLDEERQLIQHRKAANASPEATRRDGRP